MLKQKKDVEVDHKNINSRYKEDLQVDQIYWKIGNQSRKISVEISTNRSKIRVKCVSLDQKTNKIKSKKLI